MTAAFVSQNIASDAFLSIQHSGATDSINRIALAHRALDNPVLKDDVARVDWIVRSILTTATWSPSARERLSSGKEYTEITALISDIQKYQEQINIHAFAQLEVVPKELKEKIEENLKNDTVLTQWPEEIPPLQNATLDFSSHPKITDIPQIVSGLGINCSLNMHNIPLYSLRNSNIGKLQLVESINLSNTRLLKGHIGIYWPRSVRKLDLSFNPQLTLACVSDVQFIYNLENLNIFKTAIEPTFSWQACQTPLTVEYSGFFGFKITGYLPRKGGTETPKSWLMTAASIIAVMSAGLFLLIMRRRHA